MCARHAAERGDRLASLSVNSLGESRGESFSVSLSTSLLMSLTESLSASLSESLLVSSRRGRESQQVPGGCGRGSGLRRARPNLQSNPAHGSRLPTACANNLLTFSQQSFCIFTRFPTCTMHSKVRTSNPITADCYCNGLPLQRIAIAADCHCSRLLIQRIANTAGC